MTHPSRSVYMETHGARFRATLRAMEGSTTNMSKPREGRPKGLGISPAKVPANDPAYPEVVVLKTEQLSHIVASAVSEALAEAGLGGNGGVTASRLLDRSELALALDCSPGFVDKLRRQGMPCVYLGSSPRFEVERCLDWLREQKKAAP